MSASITHSALRHLAKTWIDRGQAVYGPIRLKPDRVMVAPLTAASRLALDGFIRPANSIKEFLFPAHEQLYGYRCRGKDIELVDMKPPAAERIIIGARPCDAAALPILDHVFHWDCEDAAYARRRAATTIVTLACTTCDEHCFCTSVGLGPAAERGSDVILLPLKDGHYEVRCLTAKGARLLAGQTEPSTAHALPTAAPEVRFAAAAVREFLESHFESPVWQELTLRCLGCGVCSYSCPTCHCFDIVDEGNAAGGCRARNWDSCQFAMFTLHASGHNPRAVQPKRQRQRLQHKFRIYPEKFGEILCTGCGNCARNCPVSLGILDTLCALDVAATRAPWKG